MDINLLNKKNKEIYSKIILLDLKENPIESIKGIISGGSISIDGKSSCQRSCSLTMSVTLNTTFTKPLWTLKSKIKIEIGIKNNDDIIWFPQGLYLLTSFSISQSINSISISLQGKDKMCLLDGSIGGKLSSSHDFGYIDEIQENGDIQKVKVPIEEIIREAVHTYGNEPYENIIINDLPKKGLALQTYRGNEPIYFLVEKEEEKIIQLILNPDFTVYVDNKDQPIANIKKYYKLGKMIDDQDPPTQITLQEKSGTVYYVAKYEYGNNIGYLQTNLTYAGDLVANIGEALTSVLDKIKNQLGEFEYFYNLDGQFIFQKKKNYLQANYSPLITDDYGKLKYNLDPYYEFIFDNKKLQSSISKNPTVANIKNDFITWGKRKTANGDEIPIHCRIALDKKPQEYKTINISEDDVIWLKQKYPDNYPLTLDKYIQEGIIYNAENYDWREIIFQMAKDYYKYHLLDNFLQKISEANPTLYPNGITNYEQYYEDIEGFWRYLYDPEHKGSSAEIGGKTYEYREDGWYIGVEQDPENLNFWFDFIDTSNSLIQYSISAIGDRPLPENATNVKTIYYSKIPEVLFYKSGETVDPSFSAYSKMQIPNDLEELFNLSSKGISAIEKIYSNINTNVLEQETISISCLPIYDLKPNTRILVQNDDIDINGDYIIQTISMPLTYNGTMSITANKVNPDLIGG